MEYRDRIIEIKQVPSKDLHPHPKNWRVHPELQRRAVGATLEHLGRADVLKCFYLGKKLTLLDGHLRVELSGPEQMWWVAICDFTEEEAKEFLLTYDPTAEMAGKNIEKLGEMLIEAQTMGFPSGVQEIMTELASEINSPAFIGGITNKNVRTSAVGMMDTIRKPGVSGRNIVLSWGDIGIIVETVIYNRVVAVMNSDRFPNRKEGFKFILEAGLDEAEKVVK